MNRSFKGGLYISPVPVRVLPGGDEGSIQAHIHSREEGMWPVNDRGHVNVCCQRDPVSLHDFGTYKEIGVLYIQAFCAAFTDGEFSGS